MFAYCGNNPVLYRDSYGTRHEISVGCGGGIASIWNMTYTSPFVVPSSSEVLSSLSDVVLGATENVLSRQTKNVQAVVNERGYVQIAPNGGYTMPKAPGLTNALNKASTAISVTTIVFDIGNTFTAHNNNTLGKRVAKAGIQVAGVGAMIGVGYLAVAAANFWNPVGWAMTAAAAVTFAAVSLTGAYIVSSGQTYLYDRLGIE